MFAGENHFFVIFYIFVCQFLEKEGKNKQKQTQIHKKMLLLNAG